MICLFILILPLLWCKPIGKGIFFISRILSISIVALSVAARVISIVVLPRIIVLGQDSPFKEIGGSSGGIDSVHGWIAIVERTVIVRGFMGDVSDSCNEIGP